MTMPARKALVVDDDPTVRATVTAFLEMKGWAVIQLEHGRDVSVVATSEYPDLIIMDVMMPLKDGFEAFKELKEDPRTVDIPVILLTAINDFELGARHDEESVGQRLGVPYPEGFLEKPVTMALLETAIQAALSAH